MISAVGVVVPVHNEEDMVAACLGSVRAALRLLDDRVRIALTVVLDRCTDRTADLVGAQLSSWPGARALTLSRRPPGTGVGFVRALGVRDLVRRLHPASWEQIWLLNTDSDTTVPRSWAVEQLRYARAGVHGVAGLADLSGAATLAPRARARYDRIVAAGIDGPSHRHVYGANLGVRADVYRACGGFPTTGHGEDRRLWQAMTEAGYRLSQPTALRVRTSARLRGRADGGLAELLRSLRCVAEGNVG